jgi:hypothetical protein
MKKAIWPVFWALVADFLVLAVNFIPAVGQWTLTYMAFYPSRLAVEMKGLPFLSKSGR